MSPRNETGLARHIRRAVTTRWPSAWVLKVAGGSYQPAGVPDLLVCVHGRLVGLELKHQRPGESEEHALGRATGQQVATVELIRRAGGVAGVVVSVEQALALVEQALASSAETAPETAPEAVPPTSPRA